MERSFMNSRGIVIEKLSIGWLQLLTAAFVVGGFAYTTLDTYGKIITIQTKQEQALTTYIPIINRLSEESSQNRQINANLLEAVQKLNNTLDVIQALRTRESQEDAELKKEVSTLRNSVTELTIKMNALQNQKS